MGGGVSLGNREWGRGDQVERVVAMGKGALRWNLPFCAYKKFPFTPQLGSIIRDIFAQYNSLESVNN